MVQGVQVSIGSKACLPHNVTSILNKSDRGRERERERARERVERMMLGHIWLFTLLKMLL